MKKITKIQTKAQSAKKPSLRAGFTIIELLVSMSIFLIFIALSAGSYIGLMKANRDVTQAQRVYRDVRHVLDTLSQEVRNGQIDFSCFDPASGDAYCLDNLGGVQKVLALTHQYNNETYRTLYSFSEGYVRKLVQKRNQTGTLWDSIGTSEPITAEGTHFDDVTFRVFPLKNPYDQENAGDDGIQWQPSVGISIKRGDFDYRTTYSSRSYGSESLYKNQSPDFNPALLNAVNTSAIRASTSLLP